MPYEAHHFDGSLSMLKVVQSFIFKSACDYTYLKIDNGKYGETNNIWKLLQQSWRSSKQM